MENSEKRLRAYDNPYDRPLVPRFEEVKPKREQEPWYFRWFLPLYLILAIILLIAGCYKAFGQEVSMAKPIAFTGLFCESEGAAEYISEQQNEAQMRQVLALSPTCFFRPFLLLAHDTLRLKDGWFIYRVTVATQNGIAIGYLATTVALGQSI